MATLDEEFIKTMMRAEACYVEEVLASYPRTCLIDVETKSDLDNLKDADVVFNLKGIQGSTSVFDVKLTKGDLASLEFSNDTKEYLVTSGEDTFSFMFLELSVIHH